MPFVTAEIDAAQQRVEDYYASQGFNSLQIEVEAEPDLEAGTVAVEFAMLEGLQQMLREVTTAGATRTREGVIRRALRLRIGEPVNLARLVAGAKAAVRHQRVPPGGHRAGADGADDRGIRGGHSAGARRGARRRVSGLALRYGVQFTDEKSEVPDPDGDRTAPAEPRRAGRPAEPEPVWPRDYRRHRRALRAQSAGGEPVHVEQLVLWLADSIERVRVLLAAAVRCVEVAGDDRSARRRQRRAALAALPAFGGDLELPLRARASIHSILHAT